MTNVEQQHKHHVGSRFVEEDMDSEDSRGHGAKGILQLN